MFRELRRKKQALPRDECINILKYATSGVLALSGDDGYPYTVPLSFVFDGKDIYFHSAKTGHKLDAIRHNPKCSFCVIAQDQIVSEEYTTYFQSVILFGKMHLLEDEQEKYNAIVKLAKKYAPNDTLENCQKEIVHEWKSLCILKMTIDHLTGKESIEFVREREKKAY